MAFKVKSGSGISRWIAGCGFIYIASALWAGIAFGQDNDPADKMTIPTPTEVYKRIYSGWKWWHVYCYRCHGVDALGSTLAVNLRDSIKDLSYEEYLHTVREGRPKKGMQAWNVLLDDKQITDLYIYIKARSDEILPPGRPDEIGDDETPWIPPQDWPATPFPTPDSILASEVQESENTEAPSETTE
jgi:mono/diheme cytochrome c family protein